MPLTPSQPLHTPARLHPQVLYMYDLHSLEQMLEHVLGGLEWQGVVMVPYSLKRYLGHQQDSDTVIDFIRNLALPGSRIGPVGARYGYGEDGYDDDAFQIGGGMGGRIHRKAQASLLVKQTSVKQAHAAAGAAMAGTRSESGMGAAAFGGELPLPPHLHRELGSITERRIGSASGAAGERRLSFLAAADMAPGMQQRKFMSLLDKQVASPSPGSATGDRAGREGSGVTPARGSGTGTVHDRTARSTPSEDYQPGVHDDEGGLLEEEDGMEGDDEQECYHEVHAIPLLDPVLDKQVRA